MKRVLILGAFGMLGSMLIEHFVRAGRFDLAGTVRSATELERLQTLYPAVDGHMLDAELCSNARLSEVVAGASWIINAIGLIKQRIVDTDDPIVERAVRVNALFSFALARVAAATGAKVIQVATDCVFSGSAGRYSEAAVHDCCDVYGKTKSLGEVRSPAVHNLRCSIIGPERPSGVSLLNWFLTRERGSTVSGFVNHRWNGVTTLHFAKLCAALIEHDLVAPGLQHVVPADAVTKDGLLRLFARAFDRRDVVIAPVSAQAAIDRTLATANVAFNAALWEAAGYPKVPTIAEMVLELAEQQRRADVLAGVPATRRLRVK